MPSTFSAPIGAFVSSTKARAKRRRRPRHAGHVRGGGLSTIASIGTEAKGDGEAIAFASPTECDLWKDDGEDGDTTLLDCYGGTSTSSDSLVRYTLLVEILIQPQQQVIASPF